LKRGHVEPDHQYEQVQTRQNQHARVSSITWSLLYRIKLRVSC
jgi:hypothetical protein